MNQPSIWDMLAGRRMSLKAQFGLVGNELPAMMITSCETAEDICTQLGYAVEVNDGRRVNLIFEEDSI